MAAPVLHQTKVAPEWVDEFGHMNMACYLQVCDAATYAFWEWMNDGVALAARGGAEYAVVEAHVNYLREVQLGDALAVSTQLLDADEKRFRLFHVLYAKKEKQIAATNEIMALGFDLGTRRLCEFKKTVREKMRQTLAEHAQLPPPENAGRGITMSRQP
ncbi:MAG: thioesterase family protein [Gammaproteobacteria bacterium]|nr:thioesterase family protein [Gammaproteobacteria bacterium]